MSALIIKKHVNYHQMNTYHHFSQRDSRDSFWIITAFMSILVFFFKVDVRSSLIADVQLTKLARILPTRKSRASHFIRPMNPPFCEQKNSALAYCPWFF